METRGRLPGREGGHGNFWKLSEEGAGGGGGSQRVSQTESQFNRTFIVKFTFKGALKLRWCHSLTLLLYLFIFTFSRFFFTFSLYFFVRCCIYDSIVVSFIDVYILYVVETSLTLFRFIY